MDRLYEAVVADPARGDDAELAGWASDLQADFERLPKEWAREVRRTVRLAGKLARHVRQAQEAGRALPADWRSVVDAALGGRGWEPSLAIARLGLDSAPSPELYEAVRTRFRVARFTPWMEGVTFDEWLAGGRADNHGQR